MGVANPIDRRTGGRMDRDPELDVTLSDGRQVLTFQIAAITGREAWAIVEPRAPLRVIRGCAAALAVRQRVDTQIAARLAAGWVPVDRCSPSTPPVAPTPLPPDLVLQISSLLEGLTRARPALRAADPSGQLWAACQVFRQQAWRFAVGAPHARVLRARRERRLGELAEQAGDRAPAFFYYHAALASYARVGVKRHLAWLTAHGAAAPTAREAAPPWVGDAEVDSLLADYRYRVLRMQREEEGALGAGADEFGSETGAADAEDAAVNSVSVALPEERRRIKELLAKSPQQRETKVEKLIGALGVLWRQNPQERMVVFATYLGSVEMLGAEIERAYPGQGVTVLKGGDHSAKTAAERRFKAPDGPRVLICTAAGREGINLQHARVLFNFDLPWNPMDLEQRIGRIHRYGQRHTAQVYNLVLSDTIEGSIFLLLDEKLTEIGRALGKVDERGQIAEDLRTQILGQLSMQVNYASLYSEALNDPELKRTKVELDSAMSNAVEARKVVFELFQELDGFRLDDYKAMGNPEEGAGVLARFLADAASAEGEAFNSRGENLFVWFDKDRQRETLLTTQRELSLQEENVQFIGLDHPLVAAHLRKFRDLPPDEIGVRVQSPDGTAGVLAMWAVEARGDKGQLKRVVVPLAVDAAGKRLVKWEREPEKLCRAQPAPHNGTTNTYEKLALLRETLEPMLQRELEHRGVVTSNRGFEAKLIGWV
jgi:hypothetical protein